VYLPPPGRAVGTAVIVNPGGGYHVLVGDHEGVQVARWLNRQGITAFVLRYRLLPNYSPEVALLDGKRAVRWVRHHAAKYGVSKRRIGMMGFSAGGNLATAVGTSFAESQGGADEVDRESARPDFLVPIYPVISHEILREADFIGTQDKVSADTPPTFLAHTQEDPLSSLHSIRFYEALVAAGVPASIHVFTHGAHGMGLGAGDPDLARWPVLLLDWLRRQRFMTDAERVPVEGKVQLGGEPMPWGWVTLIPEDPNQPIAATVLDSKSHSAFSFDAEHGPCPGKHRVELRVLSTPKADLKTGAPSLADAEVFVHPSSQSSEPIWVHARAGAPIAIDVRR
jgi:acetyl esterase/lipase